MPLLTSASYPAVRAALDTSLDSTVLPDSIIGLPIYAGAAEAEVLRRDPNAADRTGAALAHVTNAAILLCAALLAPALPQIASETRGAFAYTRQQVDVAKLVADLRARAGQELDAVLTPDAPTPGRPTMFTLGVGRRGR